MPTTTSSPIVRTHIALAVADLEASIDFYQRLLGVEPAKVREGYAKFEPDAPALSLALNGPVRFERDGRPDVAAALAERARETAHSVRTDAPSERRVEADPVPRATAASLDDDCLCCRSGAVTHLGIQLANVLALDAARTRLESTGLPLRIEADVTCCYARQDKLWAVDPDGNPWEVYVVLEDVETGVTTESTAADVTDPVSASGPTDACCAGSEGPGPCC